LLDSTAPTHPAPSIQCLSLLRLYQVDYYGKLSHLIWADVVY
jgi:hypothetical protein